MKASDPINVFTIIERGLEISMTANAFVLTCHQARYYTFMSFIWTPKMLPGLYIGSLQCAYGRYRLYSVRSMSWYSKNICKGQQLLYNDVVCNAMVWLWESCDGDSSWSQKVPGNVPVDNVSTILSHGHVETPLNCRNWWVEMHC